MKQSQPPERPPGTGAAKSAEDRFRAAFENASSGVALLDLDGRFLQVNQAFCRMLGWSEEELLSMTWRDVTHPKDRGVQEAYEKEALDGGEDSFQWEKRHVRPDGSHIWTMISRSLVRGEEGNPLYFISQVLDISAHKRAEEALRAREEETRQILEAELSRQREELAALHETTLDLISRLEPSSLLGAVLSRAAALIGAKDGYLYVVDERAGELVLRAGIGMFEEHLGYRLQPGEGVAGRVWQTGEPQAIDDYQAWEGRVAGWDMIQALVALPLRAGAEMVGVIGLVSLVEGKPFEREQIDLLDRFARLASVALDNARLYTAAQDELRERRRAEKELERYADELKRANQDLRAADELKNHFVAVTSHELRTPLTSVMGFARILLKHWERMPDEEKLEQIRLIEDQSLRLSRLVEELLTLSKIRAGVLEVSNTAIRVRDAVDRVVSSFVEHLSDIDVKVPRRLRLRADPDYLHQMLTNYVANALNHGGPPIRIEAREADGVVEIFVRDRGTGVPEEFVPRLFERFAQAGTKEGGTGLGLSIVRGLARAQGGEAWYEPDPSGGACFGVRLPSA